MRGPQLAGVAALVVVGWLAATGVASAHDDLLSSTPADGESVDRSPAEVVLEFSGPPQDLGGSAAVVVTRTSGTDGLAEHPIGGVVSTSELTLEGNVVRQPLAPALDDGEYTVAYRVVSSDGHQVEGTTHFWVGPVPPAGAPFGSDEPAEDDPGWTPLILTIGAAVVVVTAVVVVGVTRRRRGVQ